MIEFTLCGWQKGSFVSDKAEKINYAAIFGTEPFSTESTGENKHFGSKAVKYPVDESVNLTGLRIGNRYHCFFNSSKKVVLMQPINDNKS